MEKEERKKKCPDRTGVLSHVRNFFALSPNGAEDNSPGRSPGSVARIIESPERAKQSGIFAPAI
jgi:hypothetical protein